MPEGRKTNQSKPAESDAGVTILGAGDARREDVEVALRIAPRLVAADGGAAKALEFGFSVDAVIGDMDSIAREALDQIPEASLHAVDEQDSTDFEKCLTRIRAPLIVAVGVTAPRLDHGLASLNAIAKHRRKRVIILSGSDVCFLAPPQLALRLAVGERLSLFPLHDTTGGGRGLKWPIDGIRFSPTGRIGTSNEATAEVVEFSFEKPGMLVLVGRKWIGEVATALRRAARWRESGVGM